MPNLPKTLVKHKGYPPPEKQGMGRKLKHIDWDIVARMAKIHCSQEEIAAALGVSKDTLNNHCQVLNNVTFAEFLQQNRGHGKISLRRMLWKKAAKGDPALLIWLSKNYLGMTDKTEHELVVKYEQDWRAFPTETLHKMLNDINDDSGESNDPE